MARMTKYLYEYEAKTYPVGNGKRTRTESVYIGDYFGFDLSDDGLRRLKLGYALASLVLIGLYVAMALSGASSMGGAGIQASPYVIAPYALLLLPLVMSVAKVVNIIAAQPLLEHCQYDSYVVELRRYTVLMLIAAVGLAAGEGYHIIWENTGALYNNDLALLLEAIGSILAGSLFLYLQLKYKCGVVKR